MLERPKQNIGSTAALGLETILWRGKVVVHDARHVVRANDMKTHRQLVVPLATEESTAPCACCDAAALHRVICMVKDTPVPETLHDANQCSEVESGSTWALLSCNKCSTIILRTQEWFYLKDHLDDFVASHRDPFAALEDAEARFLSKETHTAYLPNHKLGLSPVRAHEHLPETVKSLYSEAFAAAEAGHSVLAVLGLRTIIQRVCRERGAKEEPLARQIDFLREQGLLSIQQASFLHGIRLMGNEAAHEAIEPITDDRVLQCFTIINHVLTGMYVLPKESPEFDARKDPTGNE